MKVVIVGGSLIGLMHGIMLKHNGCDVEILEQTPERMESQAAGVATSLHVAQFLDRHDRLKGDFAFPCHGIRVRNTANQLMSEIKMKMAMTTWDSLYFRLRANFDGCTSVFNPVPPPQEKGDGKATYNTGKKLVAISESAGGSEQGVVLQYKDVLTGDIHTMNADLVIGADGANSSVRSLCCPEATGRRYAGYVIWRGVVPEKILSAEATKEFSNWFSFCLVPQIRGYIVLYLIPGKDGSLKPGERDMNFAWYAQITPEELSAALTDVDGHKHNWSVPYGKLNFDTWAKQLRKDIKAFSAPCQEIASKIETPFLQVIGDHTAPQASYFGGKVLLVGDGLVTLRPHTGTAISSGAFHALELEKSLFGKEKGEKDHAATIKEWEKTVLEYSRMDRLRSISWGEYYMGGWLGWIPAALHYHGILKLKSWWPWAANLLLSRS